MNLGEHDKRGVFHGVCVELKLPFLSDKDMFVQWVAADLQQFAAHPLRVVPVHQIAQAHSEVVVFVRRVSPQRKTHLLYVPPLDTA